MTSTRRRAAAMWLAVLVVGLLAACQPSLAAPAEVAELATVPPSPRAATTAEIAAPTATLTPTLITATPTETLTPTVTPTPTHPLMIDVMRQQSYPGSEMVFEEILEAGANYSRYIISYLSEGNKIYALLTVPFGDRPPTGWPVIIFNHGFIPPAQYRTTERYVAYVDNLARQGYIVLRSDYRGHGFSEGQPTGGYGTPAYTVDVLNAVAAIKAYPDADPNRIGMWGHSMGGHITLRAMVTTNDIKAGVIWGGVVASYPDLLTSWRRGDSPTRTPDPTSTRRRWSEELTEIYGSPEDNPAFWASISPNAYVTDVSGPIQLHHGTNDTSVPFEFSQLLFNEMHAAGKPVEIFLWEGDDHNITTYFTPAMQRTIEFFNQHVKGEAG